MLLKDIAQNRSDDGHVNMTPIIDIVFLLIIFFMLVCQFIVAENFEISVPDKCSFAQTKQQDSEKFTTVSIMAGEKNETVYAVGAELIQPSEPEEITTAISKAIEARLKNFPEKKRIVCIRADQDTDYKSSQYVLAAIASSSATDIQLAVLQQGRTETE